MNIDIPQASPLASYTRHQADIDRAIARVLHSGRYILGAEVEAFEHEFAAWGSLSSVVGVSNGTDAIELMLRVLDIGEGAEVISTPHTATATTAAIERAGATPVLVDIDPATYNLDPALVESAITPRTRAIVPVHLYGQPADLAALCAVAERHHLALLEDCAQAHGARFQGKRVGTFGALSSFSFYPTKNLGALGDGGAVGLMALEHDARLRALAQYGWRERYIADEPGMNSRLDPIQAAVLRVKLDNLDADNARRREIAARYSKALSEVVPVPDAPPGCEPVYHLYVIRHERRDDLRAFLAQRGIGTAIQYPVPIHLQPAYRGRLGDTGSFPATERAVNEIVSLPMYPELTDEQVDRVIAAVLAFIDTAA